MAEERLIDDDKDRKYKIIINENGEEELVIIPSEEEAEVPAFDLYGYDEEENLTAEQAAEREYVKAEEEKLRAERTAELMQTARERLAEEQFEEARYALYQAEDLSGGNGEVYYLKLRILSRNLQSFVDLEKCALAADGVKEQSTEEQKKELLSLSGKLEEKINSTKQKAERLSAENEQGKAERRGTFLKLRTKWLANLLLFFVPLVVFLVLTAVFGFKIFTGQNGAYTVATIIFSVLAAISLVGTIISANRFWDAARNVKLNEKDTSTKLGREYLETQREYGLLTRIYSSFSQ